MKTIKLIALALGLASIGCGVDAPRVDDGGGVNSVGKYAPVTAAACDVPVSTDVIENTPCVLCRTIYMPDGSAGGDRVEGCSATVCSNGDRTATCPDGQPQTPRLCVISIDDCPLKGAQ